MTYYIVVHKDPDSDYGVTVPDLPGCFSAGSTFQEALDMAEEAIAFHLESILEDGETIPVPGNIEEHQANPDYAGGTWAAIRIDPSKLSESVTRVNITVPERVLRSADNYAKDHSMSRSGLITQALIEKMSFGAAAKDRWTVTHNAAHSIRRTAPRKLSAAVKKKPR